MSDHRALIELALKIHRRIETGCECPQADHPCCWYCHEDWPCLTVRLAAALEDETLNEQVVALGLELEAVMRERDAALARAERLAGWAQHKETCPAKPVAPIFGSGQFPTGAACTCGLDAALGLAGGEA